PAAAASRTRSPLTPRLLPHSVPSRGRSSKQSPARGRGRSLGPCSSAPSGCWRGGGTALAPGPRGRATPVPVRGARSRCGRAGVVEGCGGGAMVVAFVGTLLGSKVLSGIREVLQTLGYRLGNPAVWLIVGAGLGGMGWALWNDQERALAGAATGMVVGAAAGF